MTYPTSKHVFYYVSLALVLLGLFSVIFFTPGEHTLHMALVVLMGFFYVLWAIIHHLMHHDMHAKIVIEYVLIATVGISFVYFVLTKFT